MQLIRHFLPRRNLDQLYLFVHLPKCAGTSLLKMFSEIGRDRFVVVAGTLTKRAALDLMHSQIAEHQIDIDRLDLIMGRNVFYGMHKCSRRLPYYFTFLRDPINRYVSQYSFYVQCVGNPTHRAHEMAKREIVRKGKIMSIKEFAERGYCSNAMTRTLAAASSEQEWGANSWSHISLDEAPQQADWMLTQMSFVGFFDQFEQDSKWMCKKLNINPPVRHENVSESSDICLDPETLDIIREVNRLDFQIYEQAQRSRAS